MNRTKIAQKARIVLTMRFGTSKFRISKDGTIRVFGTMPNTSQEGWFVYGALTDVQTRDQLNIG